VWAFEQIRRLCASSIRTVRSASPRSVNSAILSAATQSLCALRRCSWSSLLSAEVAHKGDQSTEANDVSSAAVVARPPRQPLPGFQSLLEASGPAWCSMVLPPSSHPMLTTVLPASSSRSASAASASRKSSSEFLQRNVSVRAGALAVTLSSAALVLVVSRPLSRRLKRMAGMCAHRTARVDVKRSS
jgi:hypothetical protein